MSSTPEELGSELMGALAEGDELALNRLMDLWGKPLICYLTRLTGGDATALDLAQETFVRVHRHRREYRPGRKFSTWLFTIATNLARNHARWKSRHPECLLEPESLEELPLCSTEASPDQRAMTREDLAAMERAVASLPHEMREVLVLSTWHELPHAEIARIQGSTCKAVELRLYRARKLLRDLLAEQLAV
jgi:RNA polymerase sigma-70 factor, ECF subfamily